MELSDGKLSKELKSKQKGRQSWPARKFQIFGGNELNGIWTVWTVFKRLERYLNGWNDI